MIGKLLKTKFVSDCLLTLLLSISPSVSVFAAYVPPPDQKQPSEYSKPGGRRGCDTSEIPLTVIAPKKYIGYTASVRPTLAWYSSDSRPVKLSLFKLDQNKIPQKIGSSIEFRGKTGIANYSLPKDKPGLEVGSHYLWRVSMRCPQGNLFSDAEFIVFSLPKAVSKKLRKTTNEVEKIDIYAELSFWYDAFAQSLQVAQEKSFKQPLCNLIEEVASAEISGENISPKKPEFQGLKKHADNLKKIAEIKRKLAIGD